MQASIGQYSMQAGEPAQPVQQSVVMASMRGFFLREALPSPSLSGRYDAPRWSIAIAEGALLTVPDELWRLDQRVTVTIEGDAFSVSAHCWLSTLGAGRVCVDSAQARGIQARMSGTLDGVQVASVSGGLEGLRGLSGSVSGRWDLASDARGWRGTAQLATHQLAWAG